MSKRGQSKSSVIYAIASNTIVLVLIGLFCLLYLHSSRLTDILKERINIIVELENGTSKESKERLYKLIQSQEHVISTSIKYMPAEKASEVIGGDFLLEETSGDSPFLDILVFNVEGEYYNNDVLTALATTIKNEKEVSDVIYENIVIDNIKSNLNKIAFGILLLNIFFLILVIVIMYNTINLSLYADRWEIKTMEIIGARDNFIRQPYLKIAGRIGIVSFIISSIILLTIVFAGYSNTEIIGETLRWSYLLITLAVILFLSLFITIISTIKIVNGYLRKEEDELYH